MLGQHLTDSSIDSINGNKTRSIVTLSKFKRLLFAITEFLYIPANGVSFKGTHLLVNRRSFETTKLVSKKKNSLQVNFSTSCEMKKMNEVDNNLTINKNNRVLLLKLSWIVRNYLCISYH